VAVLPNGNVLLLIRGYKSNAESIAAGRNPALLNDDLEPMVLYEINPQGNIVWQWHVWDHLIQDFDASKDNFGVVENHPELVDINFIFTPVSDWLHSNAIDYHPGLDQIMVSPRYNSEIWIIDHSTTTQEAASHSGGNSGKGGDLLYRWGNPVAYRAGTADDQTTFGSHDAHWIEAGLPGAGNIMLFNNGGFDYGRDGNYSTIDEFTPSLNGYNYELSPGGAFLPEVADWTFIADPREDFYSSYISSVQRLSNGNTFIDEGADGFLFEINDSGQVLWQYQSPIDSSGILHQGSMPPEVRLGALFRAYKYEKSHAAFKGRNLTPQSPIELYDVTHDLQIISPLDELVSYPGTGHFSLGESQLIPLIADELVNYEFVSWSLVSGDATINNLNLKHTSLIMGSNDSVVQANYTFDSDWIFSHGFEIK
jgi:hypothetical protein